MARCTVVLVGSGDTQRFRPSPSSTAPLIKLCLKVLVIARARAGSLTEGRKQQIQLHKRQHQQQQQQPTNQHPPRQHGKIFISIEGGHETVSNDVVRDGFSPHATIFPSCLDKQHTHTRLTFCVPLVCFLVSRQGGGGGAGRHQT